MVVVLYCPEVNYRVIAMRRKMSNQFSQSNDAVQQKQENKHKEKTVPSHITEILRPLKMLDATAHHPNSPSDCALQQKELLEMDNRFRGAETVFAEAYSQMIDLEKVVASYQETWQSSTLTFPKK
jgi:hypothetical protein